MSGRVGHRKRLVCLTKTDVARGTLSLRGNLDFFPAVGCRSIKTARPRRMPGEILLDVMGLPDAIVTEIAVDQDSARPKAHFRDQTWIREFFRRHRLSAGDTVAIELVAEGRFRVSPFESKTNREGAEAEHFRAFEPVDGPSVIELFAGAGGMALGFKQAGFQTVLANEWDREACDTLRANITDRVLNCAIQEVKQFPKADVVAGGPPCQGFSNLGERVPNDPRNQLWRQFMRCVEESEAKYFVLENVPPLLKSAEYQELLKIAKRLGFMVEARVLNAADYGVPQARKRAIVLGFKSASPVFPEPTHVDPRRQTLLDLHRLPWRTVRDAIGHVPFEPTNIGWHIGRNPTPKSLLRYRAVPAGGNRWDLPSELMPECWKRKTKGGTDLMGRLWWDRPSVTIRTEFYKPEKGRYLHPEAHRPITHLEALLLQSFPENYRFLGSRISVGIQIGNAVPPGLAHAIAGAVRAQLDAARSPVARRSVRKGA